MVVENRNLNEKLIQVPNIQEQFRFLSSIKSDLLGLVLISSFKVYFYRAGNTIRRDIK
jgi:hypothetical protein